MPLTGGEFVTIVDTAKIQQKRHQKVDTSKPTEVPVSISLQTSKGLEILKTAVTVEGEMQADQLVNIEAPGETRYAKDDNQPETLTLNGASIDLTASAKKDRDISVTALRRVDMPALDNGMVNLTVGASSYRFLPHGTQFSEAQTVQIQYNPQAIPEGFSPHDIQTYYFNENENRWVALDKIEVDEASHTIVSTTDHFTDMINAVAKAPDMPETSAMTPTTFSGMSAADPSSQVNLMPAPTANSQGSANISYPLQLPAGRHNMTPSLALNYNSMDKNGMLGMGWHLSLPSVGIDTRWGVPRYDTALETETYTFAGQQLAPKV
ncbi:SpvB/TcaC N-terminal domain-containing protein [Psychrobacter sp. I-STPA6b]|uniref:SpvB/TcaC N-terminal domain-containing protein n=1 Tax=Psychrobacter sp. I-STPA6b TaxID=2585718 RepID=UPI001D0C8D19|nr:SpvB/TcaC N-terminal domain-containing protein [Psychrobacter sp. I-STPA6b]